MTAFRALSILLGVCLLFLAYSEFNLRRRGTDVPKEYSLAALEKGQVVSNVHGLIGQHYALYSHLVFKFRSRDEKSPATDGSPVSQYWYPIMSADPNSTDKPKFRVIVSTTTAVPAKDLPKGVVKSDAIEGQFYGSLSNLKGEERELFEKEFPDIDFDKVLLFESPRVRQSIPTIVALFICGTLFVAWPFLFKKREAISRRFVSNKPM